MKTRFYVYWLDYLGTSEFYIGSRGCDCNPIDDIKYKGSSRTWKGYVNDPIKWKQMQADCVKTIICECESRKKAYEIEDKIISFFSDKKKFPLNRNYHQVLPNIFENSYATIYTRINEEGKRELLYDKIRKENIEKRRKIIEERERVNEEKIRKILEERKRVSEEKTINVLANIKISNDKFGNENVIESQNIIEEREKQRKEQYKKYMNFVQLKGSDYYKYYKTDFWY